ncbi:MAG: hypothetical protein QM731_09040 [Chitinophagaceae bacterium]
MKRMLLTSIVFLTVITAGYSQVISSFTWETNPVTKATVGPDATSVSSAAVISTYGTSGHGLNAGRPSADINLTIPGSPYFDVPGLDVAVDFRREEAVASFVKRGNNFDFGMNGGNLSVKFLVSNGGSGSTTINSGNIYSIPNDHTFHHYRFLYNSTTGMAYVTVDGVNVYTYTGTTNRAMYWTGAGNVIVGYQMDGTNNNVAILDNLLIQNVPVNATLPVKLTSFTAQAQGNTVVSKWTTVQEENMSGFVLERSADGNHFAALKTVAAKGSYTATTQYSVVDSTPLSSTGYYRLKMVDIDGSFTYSEIRTVNAATNGSVKISCFPNPATDYVTMTINNNEAGQYRYSVITVDGKVQQSKTVSLARGSQQVTVDLTNNVARGIVIINLENINNNTRQSFKIMKQ